MAELRLRTNGQCGAFAVLLATAALALAGCGDEPETAGAVSEPTVAAAGGAAPAETVAATIPTDPVIEAHELNDWYRVVLINPAAIRNPRDLEAIARPYCEGLPTCRVGLWYSERDFPRQLPVPGYQLRYQVFAFGRTITGAENALWNCDTFPEFEAERLCLPRAMD